MDHHLLPQPHPLLPLLEIQGSADALKHMVNADVDVDVDVNVDVDDLYVLYFRIVIVDKVHTV